MARGRKWLKGRLRVSVLPSPEKWRLDREERRRKVTQWHEEWRSAGHELGLALATSGNFPSLTGTFRGFGVEVKAGDTSSAQNPGGGPYISYQIAPNPASVMAGWMFHAHEQSAFPLPFRQVQVSLLPPEGEGTNPTSAFLGDTGLSGEPSSTVHLVVSGRDRNTFVQHLTEHRKAALWHLFRIATPDIKNGTIRCRFGGYDGTGIVRMVQALTDSAIALHG